MTTAMMMIMIMGFIHSLNAKVSNLTTFFCCCFVSFIIIIINVADKNNIQLYDIIFRNEDTRNSAIAMAIAILQCRILISIFVHLFPFLHGVCLCVTTTNSRRNSRNTIRNCLPLEIECKCILCFGSCSVLFCHRHCVRLVPEVTVNTNNQQ